MNDLKELEEAGIIMKKDIRDDLPVPKEMRPFRSLGPFTDPFYIQEEFQNPNISYLWVRLTYTTAELMHEIDVDNLEEVRDRGYLPLSASCNFNTLNPEWKIIGDRIHCKGLVLMGKLKQGTLEDNRKLFVFGEPVKQIEDK